MSSSAPTHFCRKCGSSVEPLIDSKVNPPIAILLLFCGLLPGLVYLAWGASQRVDICPVCETKDVVIPIDSPEARRQLRALGS
jgi:hypothetical protein